MATQLKDSQKNTLWQAVERDKLSLESDTRSIEDIARHYTRTLGFEVRPRHLKKACEIKGVNLRRVTANRRSTSGDVMRLVFFRLEQQSQAMEVLADACKRQGAQIPPGFYDCLDRSRNLAKAQLQARS